MNNILIALLCIDLAFLNAICIGFCIYGLKLIKQMKNFLNMFGGNQNEIR